MGAKTLTENFHPQRRKKKMIKFAMNKKTKTAFEVIPMVYNSFHETRRFINKAFDAICCTKNI